MSCCDQFLIAKLLPRRTHVMVNMTQLQMFQKVEYGWGSIFKVVLFQTFDDWIVAFGTPFESCWRHPHLQPSHSIGEKNTFDVKSIERWFKRGPDQMSSSYWQRIMNLQIHPETVITNTCPYHSDLICMLIIKPSVDHCIIMCSSVQWPCMQPERYRPIWGVVKFHCN